MMVYTEVTAILFCARYVNRGATYRPPMLRDFKLFGRNLYVSGALIFGSDDFKRFRIC